MRIPWILAVLVSIAPAGMAQESVNVEEQPTTVISNDKLELAIRNVGGAMARLTLKDQREKINPMHTRWGHFVCVDGFGPVSAEEKAAGLPGHGEANRVPWKQLSSEKKDRTLTASFTATLPLVQEVFNRTFRLVDGENVVYVESELENLMAFDRPVNWAEHATIGPPFLELGSTDLEMSAIRAATRPHESQSKTLPHRLADTKDFKWPMAPGVNGELIDVRATPTTIPFGDHTTSLMDPSRRLVFVTAFNPARRLLLGYIFRREEYPWTQLWESFPHNNERFARGLEFATQPFDLPRREVIQANTMFDAPTYRWLPAKSKITSSFLLFYTSTPEGFSKVDDVTQENGKITILDRSSGKQIKLDASRQL